MTWLWFFAIIWIFDAAAGLIRGNNMYNLKPDGPGGVAGNAVSLIAALVVLALLIRRRWKPALRVEEWRAAAVQLRVDDPRLYALALAQAATPEAHSLVANDPDAFVALILAELSDAGLLHRLEDVLGEEDAPPDPDLAREYALLALGLEPDATDTEIKAAHRDLVRAFHPDRGGLVADADDFKDVQAAYEFLVGRRADPW